MRQTEKEALSKKASQALILANPKLSQEDADTKAWHSLEGFVISTPRSLSLRARATGLMETFIGGMLNRIASEMRPAILVVEELDFRGCGLSPALNTMLTNCSRSCLDQKLKDLHEKFAMEIVRVEAPYTSQECSVCGHIESKNRQGEAFDCLACHHKEHADINSAKSIQGRRPLPGSKRLSKARGGFSWEGSTLPRLSPERYQALKDQGFYHPRLYDALTLRNKVRASQASLAAPTLQGGISNPLTG